MRLPAHLDGLDSAPGLLLPSPSLTGRGEGEKQNHPADSTSSYPPCFHFRTTFRHAVIRLLVGGLLYFGVSSVHATAPVGTTPGNLEVTTRGSASYTIPVVIPPGTRGMQPKLTLTYDSQAGNGFLGHGWSLGGLSVIHRCGATILLDGFKGGVKYDANDKFCLDGERLVVVDGVEYHTRHETWQRVIPSDMSSNPASFIVYAKDGYILEYGVTEDSRIQAQGSANVRVWALNKMTDRLGNYYTIQYQEDNANGDYRPGRIDYTGNAAQGLATYNSVVFQYETRTDTLPRYEAGSVMKTMQRMTHVLSYTGATLVRDYRLTYDNDGAVGRSRLTSVQECGTDGVCLPSTSLTWTPAPSVLVGDSVNTGISVNPSYGSIVSADINGDGRGDLAWSDASNCFVHTAMAQSSASGFVPATNSGVRSGGIFNNTCLFGLPISIGDVNGDNLNDAQTLWGANIYYYLGTSGGLGSSPYGGITIPVQQLAALPLLADVDGDGRTDALFVGGANSGGPYTLYYALSTGNGFGPLTTSTSGLTVSGIAAADFNSDGRNDLLLTQLSGGVSYFSYALSIGVGYGPSITTGISGQLTAGPWPADINGDGKSDLVWIQNNSIYYSFSTGAGFTTALNSSVTVSSNNVTVADVNGDGSADVVWKGNDGYIYESHATGDGFGLAINIGVTATITSGPWAIDFNGDGKQDLVWLNNGTIYSSQVLGGPNDLLVSVTNGLGEQRQLTYKPLTDDTIYASVQGETYPYREIRDATYVVRSLAKSDGLGGMATTYYTYGGQLMHVTANERLGFAWIQRAEPDGSWVNDYYHQDVNFSGTLSKSETYVPGPVLVKKTVNDWRLGSGSYERIMNRLFGVTEEAYELDGSLINRTTTATDYDGWGYPLTTAVEQLDGRKKTTVNTYYHDLTYWTLGLKTLEQVTAEAPGSTTETRTTDYGYYQGLALLAYERTEPNDSVYTLQKTHSYDVFGNRTKITVSGTGIVTRETAHAYDSTGRFRVRTTNALGHYETLEYDPRNGQPSKHTGPNGLITIWDYDGLGRKEKETRPDATATVITRGAWSGGDYVLTDTSGTGKSYVYRDILGRTVQEKKQGFGGNWIHKDTLYDNLGRVASISLPYFSGDIPLYTVNEYDALQRIKKVTAPGGRITTTTYNGLSTTVTNPKNQVTTTIKDSEDHVIEVIDAALGHTRSAYDAFGNLVQVTDKAGNISSMTYDIRGRKTTMNDPDMGSWTYKYNTLGELTRQTDAKGQKIVTSYDDLGRMTTRKTYLAGSSTPETSSFWAHDTAANGKGKLSAVYSNNANETYSYDSLSRLSAHTIYIGGITYTTSYGYDAYSRPLTLTYPITGFKLYNVYDAYGHLTEVRKDTASGLRYWKADTSDAHNRLTKETLGNGLISQRAYDPATGDLQTIKTGAAANPASIQNLSYQFDALDNLTTRADAVMGYTETFYYDDLNRLSSVTGPAGKSYSYYPNGNIRFKSDVGVYSYNGPQPHAVSQVGGYVNTTYTYDANGSMTSGNGRTITYHSFNKPKTIAKGGTTDTITYDAHFNRLAKSNGSGATTYIGKRYEKLVSGVTTTQKHYIYAGNNLVGVSTVVNGGSPATSYFHTDHLGSVNVITNIYGIVNQRLSYDAHGKRRNANGTDAASITAQTTYGYTGHEHDDELALIN